MAEGGMFTSAEEGGLLGGEQNKQKKKTHENIKDIKKIGQNDSTLQNLMSPGGLNGRKG